MQMLLPVHIAAGAVGIVTGYAALVAAKGGGAHRKSGTWFVWSMLVMALTAAAIALVRGEASAGGGILTAYLVVTGLTTVRPPAAGVRWVERGGVLVALAVGVATFATGVQALGTPTGALDGVPAPMLFIFAAVALLAAAGDLRMMRAGGIRGARRLARHLWRMCYAMWIATGSFFLGQADEFPEALRVWPVLFTLAFLPLLAMAYWMWRVRVRNTFRPAAPVRPPARVAPALAGEPSR